MSINTKIKNMDSKQKVKLGILVIVVIIIIWQLPSLLGDSSSPAASTQANSNVHVTASGQKIIYRKKIETKVKPKEIVVEHIAQPSALQKSQKHYIKQLNELQTLQLEQQIAKTKQSIVQSKLSVTQSEEKIKKLTAAPPPPRPVSLRQYANNMGNGMAGNSAGPIGGTLKLLYISNNNGNWQAILGLGGKLFNVHLNTTLPNGAVVTKITKKFVVLNNNGAKQRLTLSPMM